MRHIATLIAAVVIAPLAWVLLAFGQDRSTQVFEAGDHTGTLPASDFAQPVIVLAAAGLILGLIATLRFSPLGAVVAGAGYTATYLLLLVSPSAVTRLFRHSLSIAGWHADMSLPIRTGTSLVLGGLLLVALVSVGRWRRPRRDEQGSEGSPESAATDGDLAPGTSPLDTEPEWQARYRSQPRGESAAGSGSSWVTSLRGGYDS
jgi:hypothetical protein